MKDRIDLIFSDLKNEVITEKQAHQQVLDLFAVIQQSELLIALKDIEKCCDNQNPTHEEIWRIAYSVIKNV